MVNSKCPNCSRIIKKDQCMFCGCVNYNIDPFLSIPEEIKKKVIENFPFKKPIREELDENKLELLLKDSLKMCKYEGDYNLLKTVDRINLVSITQTENGFDLYYNPSILMTLNNDEIKAALRHEIFHPITTGFIKLPKEEIENQHQIWKIYFEMINHKEHINKIPNDIEFRKLKQGTSYNAIQTILIQKREAELSSKGYEYDRRISGSLLKSLELLIYYFYDDTKTIMPLIKKYNLQAVWELFSWINHDLSYIQKNTNKINESLEHMGPLAQLVNFVNLKKILVENKIEFDEELKIKLQEIIGTQENKIIKKLLEFWQERILENGLN